MVIYQAGKLGNNNFIEHYKKPRNYKIKKEFLLQIQRPPITPENIEKIIININNKLTLTSMSKITQNPINTTISEYITKINKNQIDALSSHTENINFNKEMANRQDNYKHNYLYFNEINSQLNQIRTKEREFVKNQIKDQLTKNKNDVQNNIKSQTKQFTEYNTAISDTSKNIGDQINEYVKLRKFKELLPETQQVMF